MVFRPLAMANLFSRPGGVAQLVERYVRNVEAEGSSPFTSTGGLGQGLAPHEAAPCTREGNTSHLEATAPSTLRPGVVAHPEVLIATPPAVDIRTNLVGADGVPDSGPAPFDLAAEQPIGPVVLAQRVRRLIAVAAIALTAGLLIDQLRVVLSFGRYHADEDQTLLWYAGRELLHGSLHEPNFYGQKYNTVFEALPGALFHLTGLAWGTAIPLGTALLATMAWVALAIGAYRRGNPVAALLALAAPLLMRAQYLLLFDAPRGVLAGDLAAALATAVALGSRRHEVRICALVGIGGLGVLWDNAAALLVIPVLIYIMCSDVSRLREHPRRTGFLVSVAAVPPLGWYFFAHVFYSSHTYDLTYPSVSTTPHWSMFVHNIHGLELYTSFFAPALAPVSRVAVILLMEAFVLVLVLAIRRRAIPLLLATCSLVVLICLALSLNRASDVQPGLYLSGPRLLLTLPFAVWFLVLAASEAKRKSAPSDVSHIGRYVVVITSLALISLVATQITFSSVASHAVAPDLSPLGGVRVTNPTLISSQCARITKVYRDTGAQLLASNDLNLAYGCAAEDGINTIAPYFDRRGWVIRSSIREPVHRILVQVPGCRDIPARAGRCTPEPANVVLVLTPSVPVATVLGDIAGMHVRRGSSLPGTPS
jgi:hypothetical protein